MQASLKMSAVLNCYEAERAKGRDVSIILSPYLNDVKLFFDDLHLNAPIYIFEENIGFGNHPFLYFFVYKRRIKRFIKQIGIDDNTHFFFTDVNDFRIGMLLPYLTKCSPTQILTKQDIIDGPNYQDGLKTSNVKRIVRSKLLSFFYSTHFYAAYEYGSEQLWTDRKACCLPMIDYSDNSIINNFKLKVTNDANCVVFFTSQFLNTLYDEDEYQRLNKEIIYILHQKGYSVWVKNHPTSRNKNVIDNLADKVIPSYIPGEYLDLTSFNFAIGFLSTALATAGEQIPSYSVLNIGNVKDVKLRDEYVKYLSDFNSNIVFLDSLEDIPSLII